MRCAIVVTQVSSTAPVTTLGKPSVMNLGRREEEDMTHTRKTLHVVLRRYWGLWTLAVGAILALHVSGNAAWAQEGAADRGAVRLFETVPIPGTAVNTTGGKMYVFDISWVDQGSQTYYLADRSNAVIDIVDAKTDTLLAQLSGGFKGFTGNNGTSGPDGVT